MKYWPYEVGSYTKHEVRVYAVENPEWQKFRLSLKGISTEVKLDSLAALRTKMLQTDNESELPDVLERTWQVCIDNYLQALHRGGLVRPTTMLQRSQGLGHFEVIR